MPACSMCSISAQMVTLPSLSHSASTSISTARSRYLSTSTGRSVSTSTANFRYLAQAREHSTGCSQSIGSGSQVEGWASKHAECRHELYVITQLCRRQSFGSACGCGSACGLAPVCVFLGVQTEQPPTNISHSIQILSFLRPQNFQEKQSLKCHLPKLLSVGTKTNAKASHMHHVAVMCPPVQESLACASCCSHALTYSGKARLTYSR
eukprot:1155797-Pelagomonas_calceolata.AAC.3